VEAHRVIGGDEIGHQAPGVLRGRGECQGAGSRF
jgi:hypothetical protein